MALQRVINPSHALDFAPSVTQKASSSIFTPSTTSMTIGDNQKDSLQLNKQPSLSSDNNSANSNAWKEFVPSVSRVSGKEHSAALFSDDSFFLTNGSSGQRAGGGGGDEWSTQWKAPPPSFNGAVADGWDFSSMATTTTAVAAGSAAAGSASGTVPPAAGRFHDDPFFSLASGFDSTSRDGGDGDKKEGGAGDKKEDGAGDKKEGDVVDKKGGSDGDSSWSIMPGFEQPTASAFATAPAAPPATGSTDDSGNKKGADQWANPVGADSEGAGGGVGEWEWDSFAKPLPPQPSQSLSSTSSSSSSFFPALPAGNTIIGVTPIKDDAATTATAGVVVVAAAAAAGVVVVGAAAGAGVVGAAAAPAKTKSSQQLGGDQEWSTDSDGGAAVHGAVDSLGSLGGGWSGESGGEVIDAVAVGITGAIVDATGTGGGRSSSSSSSDSLFGEPMMGEGPGVVASSSHSRDPWDTTTNINNNHPHNSNNNNNLNYLATVNNANDHNVNNINHLHASHPHTGNNDDDEPSYDLAITEFATSLCTRADALIPGARPTWNVIVQGTVGLRVSPYTHVSPR